MAWFYVNSSRHHLYSYNKEFAEDITPEMYVLDAGAGTAPYRALFAHANYETADFQKVDKQYTQQTYVCDLANIPVEDERYDRIIFNQVMEHLPEPGLVLKEFNRILKAGGKLICTCPLFFEEHEKPYDFYRYTQFGLRHLFETAGFEIERIEWMEGYLGTLSYQLRGVHKHVRLLPRKNCPSLFGKRFINSFSGVSSFILLLTLKPVAQIASGILSRLDRNFKIVDRGYPLNYVTIAQKPK